jgi:hypothetical protein
MCNIRHGPCAVRRAAQRKAILLFSLSALPSPLHLLSSYLATPTGQLCLAHQVRAAFGLVRLVLFVLLTAHTFACLWWFYQKQQNPSLMEPGYDFTVLPDQIPTWAQLEEEDVLQHSYSLCLAFVLMLFAGNTNQS